MTRLLALATFAVLNAAVAAGAEPPATPPAAARA